MLSISDDPNPTTNPNPNPPGQKPAFVILYPSTAKIVVMRIERLEGSENVFLFRCKVCSSTSILLFLNRTNYCLPQGKYVDRFKYLAFVLEFFYHKETILHVLLHDGASAHKGRIIYLALRSLGWLSDHGVYGLWSGEGQIADRPEYHGWFKAIGHRILNEAQFNFWLEQVKITVYDSHTPTHR